jgi:hypothetical protein
MILRGGWAGLVLALSVSLAGCSGSGGSPNRSTDVGRVDAQVLQDVVEWAFPLPGAASQDRAHRIRNFTNNLASKECGREPVPLDYVDGTSGYEYPDLELIRTRGLAPIYHAAKYYHLKRAPKSELSRRCADANRRCRALSGPTPDSDAMRECYAEMDRLHPVTSSRSYRDAMDDAAKAAITWQDDTGMTVRNTEAVLAAAKPMAQCLRDGTGLHITDDNPAISFAGSADVAYFSRGSTVTKQTMWEWSRLYAKCAAPYFEVVTDELLKRRPALIERYREALETYAAKLVKLGYVP